MFTNERYVTREVAERVPIGIQLLMWDLVEKLEERDYLQIFELTPKGSEIVEIIHKQEMPEVMSIYKIKNNEIKDEMKLYVIDNGEYSMMMFTYEY